MLRDYVSVLSHGFHLVVFSCRKPKTKADVGSLIFSIDIDVGNEKLGEKNRGRNDRNVHDYLSESMVGRIEREAFPLFLRFFNDLEMPVTFAIRGQLTEVDRSIIPLILRSPIRHDIGAHGYYHRIFTSLSRNEANAELKMISVGMKKFGIRPKSFVFPKNRVAHLSLLAKWGYLCFRGYGDFIRDGMYLKRHGSRLYDIHPGLYLGKCYSSLFLKKITDIAVRNKMPLHVWFHLWDFGNSLESVSEMMSRVLLPFLTYAKKKHEIGVLQFETMHSIAAKSLHQ
jgi:peptidoglycan/xylan/chitin deacetylase (PgdA/CDA1 family)